jgi:hypothetical protein
MFSVELINVQPIITSIRFRDGNYTYQSHVRELELNPLFASLKYSEKIERKRQG